MATLTHGTASVVYPDTIKLPEEAGSLSPETILRTEKARRGVGLTCTASAEAMIKYPDKLTVPGVTADELKAAGQAAENIDLVIADVEALLNILKQGNLLLDAHAHNLLRRVLAFVRSQEKFDPSIANLVPHLTAYFGAGKDS